MSQRETSLSLSLPHSLIASLGSAVETLPLTGPRWIIPKNPQENNRVSS